MNDVAGSTSGMLLSRRWIAALVVVLGLNVSLVAWSMSIAMEPATRNVVTAPAKTSAKPLPPIAPTKSVASERSSTKPTTPGEPVVAESQPALTIVNPRQTGGAVHYAVDGEVFSLPPGQYHRLPGKQPRTIEFDRGDDYGYAEERAGDGTYAFEVGPSGWSLKQVEPAKVKTLLEACQPIGP
jgi:hypothetical protein